MNVNELREKPVFVFTSDMDWASEEMIKVCLEAHRGVPLTPFVTHPSPAIQAAYSSHPQHVGVHPNFRIGSTHGVTPDAVIKHVKGLWGSNYYRCHGFYEDSRVSLALKRAGFKFDSNLALHLQNGATPLHHNSGTTRYPVTLEDDYLLRETGLDWDIVRDHLEAPGLKIFNFHPVHVYLNTPTLDYYESGETMRYAGEGIATMLSKIVAFVKDQPGLGAYYLDDLHNLLSGEECDESYRVLPVESRVNEVKSRYNGIDASQIYATSRDANLRELEIDFILSNVKDGMRILDLGCGNGYTDIRMAMDFNVDVTGLDLSENMIKGAKQLAKEITPIKGKLNFRAQDCRTLPYTDGIFDMVVTERFLLNLPDPLSQWETISEIHRVLKPGGVYVMVEGTQDGLDGLNTTRLLTGLKPIPNRSEDNVSAIKFEETELHKFLSNKFRVEKTQRWGLYYLISRVVHPLLVAPNEPKFSADINIVAGIVQRQLGKNGVEITGSKKPLGHVFGLRLVKR